MAFEAVLEAALNGHSFAGEKRHMALGCIEQHPRLAGLVEDDRIHGVVEDLLGPDLVWITSDGNYYVGDTQWHPDAGGMLLSYHLIKIALYLDPVRKDSGWLRVIPGTHREPRTRSACASAANSRGNCSGACEPSASISTRTS